MSDVKSEPPAGPSAPPPSIAPAFAKAGQGKILGGRLPRKSMEIGDNTELSNGSPAIESFIGSSKDDLFITGGVDPKITEQDKRAEVIIGNGGNDTAILKGKREDYVAKMPGVGDYSSDDTRPFPYGSRVIMEHAETGQRTVLIDVARVGFDDPAKDAPVAPGTPLVGALREKISKGGIEFVGTDELRGQAEQGMTLEEKRDARLAATPEARTASDGKIGMTEPEKRAVLDAIAPSHPGIMDYAPVKPPESGPATMDQLLGIHPRPASTAAPTP